MVSSLDTALRRLALEQTKDVNLAIDMAEALGPDIIGATCKVRFPDEWILAKVQDKRNVDLAVWAIQHCKKKSVLEKIAALPRPGAKIRRTLSEHPLTTTRTVSPAPPAKNSPLASLDKLLDSPARLARASSFDLMPLLSHAVAVGRSEYVSKVVDAHVQSDTYWLVLEIIIARYSKTARSSRSSRSSKILNSIAYVYPPVLDSVTTPTAELISRFSPETKDLLVACLVDMVTDPSTKLRTKIDESVVALSPDMDFFSSSRKCLKHSKWLTPAGLEKVLTQPAWYDLLCLHELSPQQISIMCATIPPKNYSQLCRLINCPQDFVHAPKLLAELPPTRRSTSTMVAT